VQYLEYMTAAYSIIWVAILLYFLSLAKRERNIWEELESLRESINRGESSRDTV
jgi:CcmD family protein